MGRSLMLLPKNPLIYIFFYTKMKTIRRPLLDLNWKDFMDWRIVDRSEDDKELNESMNKKIEDIKKRILETEKDWKVFIAWLGWISIDLYLKTN